MKFIAGLGRAAGRGIPANLQGPIVSSLTGGVVKGVGGPSPASEFHILFHWFGIIQTKMINNF